MKLRNLLILERFTKGKLPENPEILPGKEPGNHRVQTRDAI